MSTRRAATRLLIVGSAEGTHVGAHFLTAARSLGLEAQLCDVRDAYAGSWWRRKTAWWAFGRRPARLSRFGHDVVTTAREWKADCVLATGIAPLDRGALTALGQLGARRVNFLTDDPWNRAQHAPWFLAALPLYDHVFSPRTANLAELRALRKPAITYLPFAYAPDQHFVQPAETADEAARYEADVLFAGGADADRVRVIEPLVKAGFDVALYGGYWDRFAETKRHARGFLGPSELRKAVSGAKVCLCLVRRANRDGHSMRSFEVPAMGGCIVAEDTPEHRELFGENAAAVVYFTSASESVTAVRALLGDPPRRARLAQAGHERICSGKHAYRDRLETILGAAQ